MLVWLHGLCATGSARVLLISVLFQRCWYCTVSSCLTRNVWWTVQLLHGSSTFWWMELPGSLIFSLRNSCSSLLKSSRTSSKSIKKTWALFAESCLPQLYDALVPFSFVTEPVIMLDIFQTGVKFIRWQEWFTETRTQPDNHHNQSDIWSSTLQLYYSSTSKHTAPFPV